MRADPADRPGGSGGTAARYSDRQTRTLDERIAIARDFVERFSWTIPMAVDRMDHRADETWAGWPERLYGIGADRRIAYRGRKGPFGFEPDELQEWLESLPASPAGDGSGDGEARPDRAGQRRDPDGSPRTGKISSSASG